MNVLECGDYSRLTASGSAKSGGGKLLGIFVASASSTPTIKVWDSTAASGKVIVNTFTPIAATFHPIPANFVTGCYVEISGTVDCTVFVA